MSLLALNHTSDNPTELVEIERNEGEDARGEVLVASFEDSAEFISTMEAITLLCGEQDETFDLKELQRLSEKITFLKEWRHFFYEPKTINFVCEAGSQQQKERGRINLPQFSSAAVPDAECPTCSGRADECKDFVLHAGGSVWATDWCPRDVPVRQCPAKREYLAVAAHPPGSSYHKIGVSLTGRGIIQIWCILDTSQNDESSEERSEKRRSRVSEGSKKPRGRPRKIPLLVDSSNNMQKSISLDRNDSIVTLNAPKKPRGRPRKIPLLVDDSNSMQKSTPPEGLDLIVKSDVPLEHKRRPRKNPLHADDPNSIKKSKSPLKTKGRLTEKLLLLENSNNGLKSCTPKKRGRPRKTPMPVVSSNDSNIVDDASTSKRRKGRPRRTPENTETSKELALYEAHEFTADVINHIDPGTSSCLADVGLNGKNGFKSYKRRRKPIKSPLTSDLVKDLNSRGDNSNADSSLLIDEVLLPGKDTNRPDDGCEESDHTALHSVAIGNEISYPTDVLQEYQIDEECTGAISGSFNAFLAAENGCSGIYYPLSVIDEEGIERNTPTEAFYSKEQTDIGGVACLRSEKDVCLPRVVLCLGHNGKVAWDVKWKPFMKDDEILRHRLGYLAAVLGNGSLEVWEIPSPNAIQNIYKSSVEEGTDPRFVKLRPVFRCSEVKCGNRQSIPLTLEWSKPAPDLILAGCHDGTVALWKFTEDSSHDTKPLLCFTADTVPIRAVSWAPGESYSRTSNVVATAGHEGIKFWDLRDPYRPLWDFNPTQKMILSLDWLQSPSCLVFSFDDGIIKTLSLSKAACNVHVTGKPFEGAKHGAAHIYLRSHFAVWSVHVSPITGMAAYCGADGSTFCFQITEKSIEKDKSRHGSTHYLCGTLQETGPNSLTLSSPLPYTAIPDLPRRARGLPPHSILRAPEKGEELSEYLETQEFDQPDKKRKPSKKKKGGNLQICAASDEEFLVFPPKIVAMHRVRWNPNPGSERWLCSGGAAGIIRCQVIDFQDP